MKDRIEKIMELEQLSASKFADAIGVQRSSISHILSGRNKPSLELVNKILDQFQQVNADWLLLGKGEMVTGKMAEASKTNGYAFESDQSIEHQTIVSNTNKPKPVKMVVFYDDGTFEAFRPRETG
jgi:transcriptional regulator with XRE-family HTH domain